MFENEKRDLRRLDLLDRLYVVSYWRVLRARAYLRSLPRRVLHWHRFPLPLRFSVVHFFILMGLMLAFEVPPGGSAAIVPILWMSAYCLTIAALSIRRRPVHWVR